MHEYGDDVKRFYVSNAQAKPASPRGSLVHRYVLYVVYFPQVVGCASTARSLGGPKCRIHSVFVPDPQRILNTPLIVRFPTGEKVVAAKYTTRGIPCKPGRRHGVPVAKIPSGSLCHLSIRLPKPFTLPSYCHHEQ